MLRTVLALLASTRLSVLRLHDDYAIVRLETAVGDVELHLVPRHVARARQTVEADPGFRIKVDDDWRIEHVDDAEFGV